MFVEVAFTFLLPFIYMSLFTSDRRMVCADIAAGCGVPLEPCHP